MAERMNNEKKKLKVIIIDPWGINASGEYLNGLIYGMQKQAELTVFTNACFKQKAGREHRIYKVFFAKSEKMREGRARTFVRGMEYLFSYMSVLKYIRKYGNCDVIHINWLLMYRLDRFLMLMLKKHCKKLVYTAHNVIPHVGGEKHIKSLKHIYHTADRIIVHGREIKKEFDRIFPEYAAKVYIQKHGADLMPCTSFELAGIPAEIREKVEKYKAKFIFIGYLYYNKGADRLIPIWAGMPSDVLLIIAGKIKGKYEELEKFRSQVEHMDNILLIDRFVSDNLANYLISQSDLILLPYRHASMSGVVFTAADFQKPVWATQAGAVMEYLDSKNDYIIANDDRKMRHSLHAIARNFSGEEMKQRGICHAEHIRESCSWDIVTQKLYQECYMKDNMEMDKTCV